MTTMVRSMAEIHAILEEALAEDLPIGEHMLAWTPDEIRHYAEKGGFWSPDRLTANPGHNPGQDDAALSRAATRLVIDGLRLGRCIVGRPTSITSSHSTRLAAQRSRRP